MTGLLHELGDADRRLTTEASPVSPRPAIGPWPNRCSVYGQDAPLIPPAGRIVREAAHVIPVYVGIQGIDPETPEYHHASLY
jgi:hypothetical protein